jgi:hypothetical protein
MWKIEDVEKARDNMVEILYSLVVYSWTNYVIFFYLGS